MPAFTITAVNTGTDELTVTGHGQVTGAGPACLRNIGGALPTGSPAINPLTDYWLIVTGPNTVKLAISSSNALLGIAIDITGAGSGTNILEIGIPYRRATTYLAGSQVKSADLDSMQDTFKALHAFLTGQTQSVWTGQTLAARLTALADIYCTTGIYGAGGGVALAPADIQSPNPHRYTTGIERPLELAEAFDDVTGWQVGKMSTHTRTLKKITFAASVNVIYVPIRGLTVGDVITRLGATLNKNTSNTNIVAADIVYFDGVSGPVASGSGYSDNSNAPGAIAFSGNFNISVVSSRRYYVLLNPGGSITPGSDSIQDLSVSVKRP